MTRRARPDGAEPVVWLDETPALDPALVGPKTATLASLRQAALPVPPGFCLTAEAFQRHLARPKLAEALQRLRAAARFGAGWRRDSALLRAELAAAPIATGTEQASRAAYRRLASEAGQAIAVRSSALIEDRPGALFAGQFGTLLGVTDAHSLLTAVRSCWLSLWADQALEYAAARDVDLLTSLLSTEMAVLVQSLVPADAAGGLLTADPARPESGELLVNAAWGLGRAVAEAETESDFWRLDADGQVLGRQLGRKRLAARARPDGGEVWERLSDDLGQQPCLSEADLRQLAQLAARVESRLGGPLEIEWALTGGQLWLLQARQLSIPPARDAARDPAAHSHPYNIAPSVSVFERARKEAGRLAQPLAPELVDLLAGLPAGPWPASPLRPWLEQGERLDGQPASPGSAVGRARLVRTEADLARLEPGEVLVASTLRPTWAAVMPTLAGLVVGAGGTTSHAAALAREWRVPAVLGARHAARQIPAGALVLVDGSSGRIWWRLWPDQLQGGGSPHRLK